MSFRMRQILHATPVLAGAFNVPEMRLKPLSRVQGPQRDRTTNSVGGAFDSNRLRPRGTHRSRSIYLVRLP